MALNPLRSFIRRATWKLVFRRKLPRDFGGAAIYVNSTAGLRYLFRRMADVDPFLLRNAIQLVKRDDVIWDIGANVGFFAFAAAARSGSGGKVIAFEPDVWLVQILRRSCLIQPKTSSPVSVIPVAVASEISLRHLLIASWGRAANSLQGYGRSGAGGVEEMQTVPTFNLDWLLEKLPSPQVIKCDVEGAEVEVFHGQSKMLENVRPIVICEVGDKAADDLTGVFAAAGYVLYDGDVPLIKTSKIRRATWNTIAIPEELLARVFPAA